MFVQPWFNPRKRESRGGEVCARRGEEVEVEGVPLAQHMRSNGRAVLTQVLQVERWRIQAT